VVNSAPRHILSPIDSGSPRELIKTLLLPSLIVIALVVIGNSQIVKAQSQQEQIDKLTEQAKKLNQDIKNIPDWKLVRAGQAFALYDAIKKGFPNGLPHGCNVVQDDNNDAEHSHTYSIKCIAS
jgi:hypothetical protein